MYKDTIRFKTLEKTGLLIGDLFVVSQLRITSHLIPNSLARLVIIIIPAYTSKALLQTKLNTNKN